MITTAINAFLFLVLISTHFAAAQILPSKIRGYKLYDAKVSITNATDSAPQIGGSDAYVRILDPKITSIGLSGVSVEIGAEFTATNQSGSVEFMTCRDLRVNGISIDVEEYAHPFTFKEDKPSTLPTPAKISIKTSNLAKGAYKELVESKTDWAVTGTVFVFGKFKKFGFHFKRVVPVKIDLTIKNPLKKT